MATARQVSANGRNARKSTGPRSPAGRAASSRNAIKHGIFAKSTVLPALHESQAHWTAHRDTVVAAIGPIDKIEVDLAERYAHLSWRSARAAKFEVAAATVALQPAGALLAVPTPDSDDWIEGLWGDQRTDELRTEAAIARRAAGAAPRAIALLTGLADRAGDEPVDAQVAELMWRHVCAAAGLPPGPAARKLLLRFWTGPGGTRTGSEPDWEYTAWVVGTVRAAVAFVAAEGGQPPDRLAALAVDELAGQLEFWQLKARAAEAAVGRAVGARQAAAVAAAMKAVEGGPAGLELAMRYESHVSRELEGVLRQLAMLRALREAKPR